MNQNQQPQYSSFKMIRALGGVGIMCGILIVLTYQLTLPIIKEKKAIALEKAIYTVLPGAHSKITFEVLKDGHFKKTESDAEGNRVFAGLDDQGQLVGFAIEAEGNGFQDVIKVIYGYSHENETLVGIKVLESKETPGLGDKIEKDEQFLENFVALDVKLGPNDQQLLHPIELVKPGKKTNPWQIDSITGATISSKAISNILGKSSEVWVPRIQEHLQEVKDQVQ